MALAKTSEESVSSKGILPPNDEHEQRSKVTINSRDVVVPAASEILLDFTGSTLPHAPVILVLPDSSLSKEFHTSSSGFAETIKVTTLCSPLPDTENVISFAESLAAKISEYRIKRVTVLGFGAGATVAQAFAVKFPHLVRRVVLVDATARVAPSLSVRIIDKLERFLPFGLPMKSLTADFDSRPLLHRLRCPAIVAISPLASNFIISESQLIASKIPNARIIKLKNDTLQPPTIYSNELIEVVSSFLDAPAKRSQKPGGSLSKDTE